ncbi:hypothetical protein DS2_15354 [Catenovulum agarivorans DS-2]|uniref:Alginate lyase domain-containing protein n=1 Tax=Catenovulum agarivorans DS-2 TaxID=1328313 RepID=W7QL36_9ALTE|nr:alginate lyase family protein [Catenovulum agarivorans]EWH08848.1 hypothetical protein DS2_15354 [Catenovulum agarivorans DS-2]
MTKQKYNTFTLNLLATGVLLSTSASTQQATPYTIEFIQPQQTLNIAKNLLDRDTRDTSRWSAEGSNASVVNDLGSVKTITGTNLSTYKNSAVQYKVSESDSPNSGADSLICIDEERLNIAKTAIEAGNPLYVAAYNALIKLADIELVKAVDPVTNKTLIAASGDIHDYHTIGAYYWPDPTKPDGLPWVYRDGEFNRDSSGPATDWSRRKNMLKSLEILNLAFYMSGKTDYLQKVREIVQTWFVDKATRMNPNLNYGKAIPGKSDGSNFAVIDFTDIGQVITAVQLIEKHNMWDERAKQRMQDWFSDYYTWLTTSELGIRESTRGNNHGTNYDYQALSLQLYLGKLNDANAQINVAKSRIDSQIDSNGRQPAELSRTKSVNYTVNNLWAFARITDLSRRHTSNDLWNYTRPDGVSLRTAFDFVVPYFSNPKAWKWKQITGGGVEPSFANLALPKFTIAQLMLGVKILPSGLHGNDKLTPVEILTYAPQF